ncbi:hypothetical protein BDZ91DRAFT_798733 [Kalaharituber pfeilii]|nr:hypothetical protein BDZ91DRAFT_798733 [Kalaharituber pfeilii]
MGFQFAHLVDLLEPLFDLTIKSPPPKPSVLHTQYTSLITSWFTYHRPLFSSSRFQPIALFSLLFPELRCDRVYALREDSLVKVIARCLGLGVTRHRQLSNWRREADGDLGEMVFRIMKQAENPTPAEGEEVTCEEIEIALEELAGRSPFSSQNKRNHSRVRRQAHEILGPIFLRLSSRESKWLTRAILKNYLPVVLPERLTMYVYHFLLPHLFAFQNDLRRAVELLETPLFKMFPPSPPEKDAKSLLDGAAKLVRPEVGVRVKKVGFVKARSCKNAAVMAKGARMSMERKYDGGKDWIKIFSKSGRDSTQGRAAVHGMVREALKILKPEERGFKKQCILEGELMEKRILEYYNIRSHVNRSGFFLGTSADDPNLKNQHLMIIFYDLLLLDSQPYLVYPYDRRIAILANVVHPRPGYVELAERFEIDFSTPLALENLREKFAQGIARRYEGFILKPCEAPYLGFGMRNVEWIKLKKDYIHGLGDTGDFAIVGGGYEPERGKARGIGGGGLTTFFAGALVNKEAVVRFGMRPSFKVVFHVSYSIMRQDLEQLNRVAYFAAKEYKKNTDPENYDLDIAPNLPPIDVYFTTPLVFEVTGGGFDRPSDTDYYILRWPRVVKIHWDRDWKEALGFEELQELAAEAMKQPIGSTVQEEEEERRWIRRLEEGDTMKRKVRGDREEEDSRSGAGELKRRVLERRATAPEQVNTTSARITGRVKRREVVRGWYTDSEASQGTSQRTHQTTQGSTTGEGSPVGRATTASQQKLPSPILSSSSATVINSKQLDEKLHVDNAPPKILSSPIYENLDHTGAATNPENDAINTNHINDLPSPTASFSSSLILSRPPFNHSPLQIPSNNQHPH